MSNLATESFASGLVGAPPEQRPPSVLSSLVQCPACGQSLDLPPDGHAICPFCAWRGDVYLFDPLPVVVEHAHHAMPDDAACLHHPTKKAIAVCAGTGDYICSLCSIELNGQTYSAAYLNTAGKEKIGKTFDRYLPRPDSTIIFFILLSFIPGINYVVLPAIVVWMPYSIYLYIKALKMRRENPLFARVMGLGRVIAIPIFMAFFALGFVVLVIALSAAIFFHANR